MTKSRIPQTDSIQELARFWDTHELSDFEDELEDVIEPVFEQPAAIQLRLEPTEAQAIRRLAAEKGISQIQLIREWVRQKLRSSKARGSTKRQTATRTRNTK